MTAILAIDAAWTVKQPSGVALLINVGGRWRCAGLAPSYRQFEELADSEPVNWDLKPTGRRPDLDRLLAVCRQLLDGEQVSLIAMDMPLSLEPIIRRRAADNAVSRAFGNQGCAVHSPSAQRPGPLADEVRARAAALGFPLATASTPAGACPALIEGLPAPGAPPPPALRLPRPLQGRQDDTVLARCDAAGARRAVARTAFENSLSARRVCRRYTSTIVDACSHRQPGFTEGARGRSGRTRLWLGRYTLRTGRVPRLRRRERRDLDSLSRRSP